MKRRLTLLSVLALIAVQVVGAMSASADEEFGDRLILTDARLELEGQTHIGPVATSPDSSRLAVVLADSTGSDLVLVGSDGSNQTVVASVAGARQLPQVFWSSDGNSIAWGTTIVDVSAGTTRDVGVYEGALDGSCDRCWSFSPIGWLPDSRTLLVSALSTGTARGIGQLDTVTDVYTPVVTGTEIFDSPSLSADGTQVAWALRDGGNGAAKTLEAMNVDGSDRHVVLAADGQLGHLRWAPNGSKFAYERSNAQGTAQWVEVININGTNPVALTEALYSAYLARAPEWTPDSRRVVIYEKTSTRYWGSASVVEVDGKERAGVPASDITAPGLLSPDGKSYFWTLPQWNEDLERRVELRGVDLPNASGNATPVGNDVSIAPSLWNKEETPLRVTYASVTAAGETQVFESPKPTAPANYQSGGPLRAYELVTTAVFSGAIEVCVDTPEDDFRGELPALFQFVDGEWSNITTSASASAQCGQTTTTGQFAVFHPTRIVGTLIHEGSPGTYVNSITFSPDGTQMAVAFGDGASGRRVVVMNLDGSNRRTLIECDDCWGQLLWSPDGAKLAVGMVIVDVATGATNPVGQYTTDSNGNCIQCRAHWPWAWTDNQTLLVTGVLNWDLEQIWGFGLLDVVTDVYTPIAETPRPQGLLTPSLSPDGTQIAYLRYNDTTAARTIEVVSIDGDNSRVVIPWTPGFHVGDPHWSPDGTRIAYTASDGAPINWIESVLSDGTDRVAPLVEGAHAPDPNGSNPWLPDSSGFVSARWLPDKMGSQQDEGRIEVFQADGTGRRILDTGTQFVRSFGVISPDGRKYFGPLDDGRGGSPLYALDIPPPPAPPVVNTPAGASVVVTPDLEASPDPLRVTFDQVGVAGFTTVTTAVELNSPVDFRAGTPARSYSLATTATFTGDAQVCVDTTGDAFGDREPQLFQFTDGAWDNVTTSTSYTSVCGESDSLGVFGVFVDARPVGSVVHADCSAPLGYDGAAFSPNGTQIAVQCVNEDTLAVDLVLMNLDGANKRTLHSLPSPGLSGRPTASVYWSPDGTKIAFGDVVIVVATGATDTVAPYAQTVDGNGNIVCTQCRRFEIKGWMADSRTLFAASRRADGTATGFGRLDSVTDAFTPTLEGTDAVDAAALSKSRTQVAFVRPNADGTAASLEVINVDGTGARVVRPATASRWFRALRWSPDGKKIAYELKGTLSAPWTAGSVTAADGTNAVAYGPVADFNSDPRWTPNSRRVLYVSELTGREGSAQIGLAQADGSAVQTLDTGWLTVRGGGQLSPDGTKYFVSTTDRAGVTGIRVLNVPVDAGPVADTPAGTDVAIRPRVEGSTETPVGLTFERVVTPGDSLVTATTGPPPPTGFQVGNPSRFYEITTTADYVGSINVCISTVGVTFTGEPRLFHYEAGAWVDTTTSITATEVCGTTTSLSPFAVFSPKPAPPSYQIQVINDGKPKKAGSAVDFDLKVTLAGVEAGSSKLVVTANSVDNGLPASAPGNSNPTGTFSYDTKKHIYSYKLKSTGLSAGPHTLYVRIGTETALRAVPFELK